MENGEKKGDWEIGESLARLREERDIEQKSLGKKIVLGIVIVVGIILVILAIFYMGY